MLSETCENLRLKMFSEKKLLKFKMFGETKLLKILESRCSETCEDLRLKMFSEMKLLKIIGSRCLVKLLKILGL